MTEPDLERLVQAARRLPMSLSDKESQRRSFAAWFWAVAFGLVMFGFLALYVWYGWINPSPGPCDGMVEPVDYAICIEDERYADADRRPY